MKPAFVSVLLLLSLGAVAQTSRKPRITPAAEQRAEALVWEPPTLQLPNTLPSATVSKPMITGLTVANVRIILEETKLVEVQKILGGKIGHKGDASEALDWLCFSGEDADGRWALWLESSEIGGGNIDGFALKRLPASAPLDRRCRVLGEGEGGFTLPVALGLGLPESQVCNLLGKPTLKYGSTLIFAHDHEEVIRKEPYTASNTVYVVLREGVVWIVQVWKDTVS